MGETINEGKCAYSFFVQDQTSTARVDRCTSDQDLPFNISSCLSFAFLTALIELLSNPNFDK